MQQEFKDKFLQLIGGRKETMCVPLLHGSPNTTFSTPKCKYCKGPTRIVIQKVYPPDVNRGNYYRNLIKQEALWCIDWNMDASFEHSVKITKPKYQKLCKACGQIKPRHSFETLTKVTGTKFMRSTCMACMKEREKC